MNHTTRRSPRRFAPAPGWLVAPLLAILVAGACDRPFQPIPEKSNAPFWIFGYLDLRADTQWVRVMPVRQNLLTDPAPIDATVTLEKIGSGRIVTLNDSLFSFTDARLNGTRYAHNFWTTERLEPKARYRLNAVRSDGAATTAVIDMPADLELSFLNLDGGGDTAWVEIRAERVLLVETLHSMKTLSGEPAGSIGRRQQEALSTADPGKQVLNVDGAPAFQQGLVDVNRTQLRVVTVRADWPYDPRLPDPNDILPGAAPSNVENGVGFVGGVATLTIPFHRCTSLASKPAPQLSCAITYNPQSASIAGRVTREPCGDPDLLDDIHLTETFPGGGAVILTWKTGWDGRYHFDGIEPGAALSLQLGPGTPVVPLPRLGPGERYNVDDLSVPSGC